MSTLQIDNMSITADETPVIEEVSLQLPPGEMHWLMGPNGSGKSTFANAVMGHPRYRISHGTLHLGNTELTEEPPHKRAGAGLFLSMQYPPALEGVTVTNLLKNAYNARFNTEVSVLEFRKLLKEHMEALEIPADFTSRYVHAGFSGGEKKRLELLQLSLLQPKVAILDEPDSGLDIDGLRTMATQLKRIQHETGMGMLIITHYTHMLSYVEPDAVHVLKNGSLVQSGTSELAHRIQEHGYEAFGT